MGQPLPVEMKYRVVVEKRSGERQVVERDLPQQRAIELQRALSPLAEKFLSVTVEEQAEGESGLHP